MAQLTISQVAWQIRVRPSAIRYYERIGLLPPAERQSGQRRYDATVLYRLAIIQRARQLGFRDITRASERWRMLSQRKLAELDQLMEGIKAVRGVLKKVDEVSMQHLGSMWQRHISNHEQGCGRQAVPSKSPDRGK